MSIPLLDRWLANSFVHRIAHKALFASALLACLGWSALHGIAAPAQHASKTAFHEWPSMWDDAALRPLALGEVEQRFAQRFPGSIARMTDGRRSFVLRQVEAPTRMLHPAVDCYRALGYRIAAARLERDAQQRMWRCFDAEGQSARKMRVCERIVDAQGAAFTDTSAWYWAAETGRSQGPWQAVTVATPL